MGWEDHSLDVGCGHCEKKKVTEHSTSPSSSPNCSCVQLHQIPASIIFFPWGPVLQNCQPKWTILLKVDFVKKSCYSSRKVRWKKQKYKRASFYTFLTYCRNRTLRREEYQYNWKNHLVSQAPAALGSPVSTEESGLLLRLYLKSLHYLLVLIRNIRFF